MKMKRILLALLVISLLTTTSTAEPSPQNKEIHKMESFIGKIEPMGMSFFMQGSHQLLDDKGEVVVLLMGVDETTDLTSFEGKNVKVSGTTSDTVEAGGKLLTVSVVEAVE